MEDTLLEKYFRGECSPEEVKKVLAWFKGTELGVHQEQELYRLWQETEAGEAHKEFSANATDILARINANIDKQADENLAEDSACQTTKNLRLPQSNWKWWLKAAAAIFLPVCFLWFFSNYFTGENTSAIRLVTIQSGPGIRKNISLEDGSVITLNANSQVTYPQHFTSHKREITLTGEAFFEVAKDAQRPFIVKTGGLFTQALGTSFNINYRPGKQNVAIALATGSVKIEKSQPGNKNQLAILQPGQQLQYSQIDLTYKVSGFDAQAILSWREGILYFKQANLEEVIQKLESWYGIHIQVSGKIPGKKQEWHYTGSYQNESLDDVLTGIAFVKNFTYEKKEDKVMIKFR
ncbi:iron dicitrate transporter FecR [Adhaeribacter aerolatus]|uniref:Iron dicitrate transporter FecR n=1 Tax=Adhaeribacter aerolatus TaxID=670289 RepID=A0A512AW08_9BACT|nr:FecR family protein [Adhaeribacter aerolatus]GEO03860.1 iron dicitrate transporter FecR [Adhaeribacter aerolatus]